MTSQALPSNWGVPILKEEKMLGMGEEIDLVLRHIWLKVVKKEYDSGRRIEERP